MKLIIYCLFASIITLQSCQSNSGTQNQTDPVDSVTFVDEHTSQNSLDWNGEYEGVTPCADCPGIKQTITLYTDNTFKLNTEYLERDTQLKDSGNFEWENNGSQIAIRTQHTQLKLKVQEGSLLILDTEGNEISSELSDMFILTKK